MSPQRGDFLVLVIVALVCSTRAAWAWEIQSFDADLAVQADGSVQVTETVEADFQGEQRHGIYRDIPLQTQDRLGIKRSIRLVFTEALDEDGRRWKARIGRIGAYERIRLGSEESVYTGRKTFKISYRVQKALQRFPDHDELYWNATGNHWAVPMRRVNAVVRLPKPLASGRLQGSAFTGAYGSTARDVLITLSGDAAIQYNVNRPLGAFEGLTVVAGWPAGLAAMPTSAQKLLWFFQDNWILTIPLLVLLLMTSLWWKLGRDPARRTIAVEYDPPEQLTPAEVGTLVDDRVDLKDVTATIVDLARRGYLAIEELKDKDYVLTRRRPAEQPRDGELKRHETLLLRSLFSDVAGDGSVRLSGLENHFYQYLPDLKSAVYEELARKDYWWGRPDSVRAFWWVVAAILFGVAWFAAAAGSDSTIFFSLLVSAGIVALFGRIMPRKTWVGARVTERVRGLEEFLRRTDEDRIKRESDPAALFERMLPYAMALGVANQWARAFDGIYQVTPVWYTSYSGGSFTPGDLTRRLDSASGRMGTVMASAPRSSGGSGFGGGFSGGGGGGGGGGAW